MRIQKATPREQVLNKCWECAGQHKPLSHSLVRWRVDIDMHFPGTPLAPTGPYYLHKDCLDKFKLRRMRYELRY